MDEADPIGNDRRRSRQARRLPPDAACALCGETQVATLRLGDRSLLEGHHVAGEANDRALLVVLCLNCHTKATSGQLDAGRSRQARPPVASNGWSLPYGRWVPFSNCWPNACYRWAAQLAQVVVVLDEYLPTWRTLPGMP